MNQKKEKENRNQQNKRTNTQYNKTEITFHEEKCRRKANT